MVLEYLEGGRRQGAVESCNSVSLGMVSVGCSEGGGGGARRCLYAGP